MLNVHTGREPQLLSKRNHSLEESKLLFTVLSPKIERRDGGLFHTVLSARKGRVGALTLSVVLHTHSEDTGYAQTQQLAVSQ